MRKIFVFGSNLAGRHGKGVALYAKENHGAIQGQGVGLQGHSYAIPTKDAFMKVMSLPSIKTYVDDFLRFAASRSDLQFEVTRIGCGLAGYKDEQIAPMFAATKYVPIPNNCVMPDAWKPLLASIENWRGYYGY